MKLNFSYKKPALRVTWVTISVGINSNLVLYLINFLNVSYSFRFKKGNADGWNR